LSDRNELGTKKKDGRIIGTITSKNYFTCENCQTVISYYEQLVEGKYCSNCGELIFEYPNDNLEEIQMRFLGDMVHFAWVHFTKFLTSEYAEEYGVTVTKERKKNWKKLWKNYFKLPKDEQKKDQEIVRRYFFYLKLRKQEKKPIG